ncbi:MAG: ferrous iron transport protein A [Rhodospirillales bacterium]|nr:ferrous iron transport protein A [Rhodospirillales bacterium]
MQHRHRNRRRAGNIGEAVPDARSLNDVTPGTTCRITRLHGQDAIRQRLLDMGFVPGAEITVMRSAPLLDPIEIRVGDAFVTVRRAEAMGIEVTDV